MGLFSSQLSSKTMVPLSRQLATSSGAGIPILRTLELVANGTRDKRAKDLLIRVRDNIRNGDTLSIALRAESKYLPPLFVELLSSGEAGGHIEAMLQDLAQYFEERLQMQRTVVSKLTYPFLQICSAWFLGTFALRALSHIGTGAFSLNEYLMDYAKFQGRALGIFGVVALVLWGMTRLGFFRSPWRWIMTNMWPLRSVTRRFGRARFFRSLSLLIASGMPITRAVERAAATTLNPYMEDDFLTAVPRVQAGDSLPEALRGCRFMTQETLEIVAVGDESGKVDAALRKASEYQMQEAIHAVNVAARAGEVLIMLLVATLIGYIVISFYSGLYGGLFDALGV